MRYAIFNKKYIHIEKIYGETDEIGIICKGGFSALLTKFAEKGYTTEGSDKGIFSSREAYSDIKRFLEKSGYIKRNKRRSPLYRTTTTYLQPFIISIVTTRTIGSAAFVSKVRRYAVDIQGYVGLAGDPIYTSWAVQIRLSKNVGVNRAMANLLVAIVKKDMAGKDTTKDFNKAKDFFERFKPSK